MDRLRAAWRGNRSLTVAIIVLAVAFVAAVVYGRALSGANCASVGDIELRGLIVSSLAIGFILLAVGTVLWYTTDSCGFFIVALLTALLLPIGVFVGAIVLGGSCAALIPWIRQAFDTYAFG